jgi:hypothetical protein
MHFKAGLQEPKATIEIGANQYKIMAPTVGQADIFQVKYSEAKDDSVKLGKLMKEYICELGQIPMTELDKIENDLFSELFTYVITPSKKK